MKPLCTVVIPAYNAAPYLEAALKSLHAQTLSRWRAVVVDDGSTDNTLATALAVKDERIQVIHQENQGVSAARNRGLEAVDTAYVHFLDADDCLLPDALELLTGALEADPALSAAYGEAQVIAPDGTPINRGSRPVWNPRPSGDVLEILLARNFVLCGALCVRTERMRAAGPFREDLRLLEDWEAWCRLAMTGPFRYVEGPPVLAYRRTEGGAVSTVGAQIAPALASLDAAFGNPALTQRLSEARLRALRRASEASVYSFAGTQHLKAGRWREARGMLLRSLRLNPAQPREAVLLALACIGWLPPPVLNRLK